MKSLLIFLIALLSLTDGFSQVKTIKRIGLVNPTAGNLENLCFLIQNKFIQADSIQIIGIFHELQTEALASSRKFSSEHACPVVSFVIIHNVLPLDSLFMENCWTSDFSKIFHETDAILFPGGGDISPAIYGEETFLTTELLPVEKNWEISFLYQLTGGFQHKSYMPFLSQRPDYLILGICLGMQEMNVAAGGSLYQDIPFQIYQKQTYEEIVKLPMEAQHRNYSGRRGNGQANAPVFHLHHLNIVKNSYLNFSSVHLSPLVPSIHHQCVKDLGMNYCIAATSVDGKVIEAFENTQFHNVYGIQFHLDFTSFYKDGINHSVLLDSDTKQFHSEFWKNFSQRLKEQK